jgi:acyl-CoA reductase-like NAD-dependent aldehyde dehydrogenase
MAGEWSFGHGVREGQGVQGVHAQSMASLRTASTMLTGSVAAGKVLAARAGKDIKVSSMELGAATPSSSSRTPTSSTR